MTNFGTNISMALEDKPKFELLQTGDTGHGKTTRALDATRFGPVYFFDLDGKLQAAVRNLPEEKKKLIFFDNFKGKSFRETYMKLVELKALFDSGKSPFATVVIDTFTMLNEQAYIIAMGKNLEKGSKAGFDEWGVIQNLLLNFFNILLSLPCNIIVNAHVSIGEDDAGKQKLGVDGQGRFRFSLAKKMSDSHYLYFDMGKFQIRAKNSNSVPANSSVSEKLLDKNGNLICLDLSCFDDFAFRVKSV